MKSFLIALIFLALILTSSSININNTPNAPLIAEKTELLLGMNSSKLFNEGFLFEVLYGRNDISFTYNDFLKSYGWPDVYWKTGDLVIGIDAKFGGIILSNPDYVALPIPGNKVTSIPRTLIDKFFPKGYKVLFNKPFALDLRMWGTENSKFNDDILCTECYSTISTAPYDPNLFEENNFMVKTFNDGVSLQVILYSFLREYDSILFNGTIQADFYLSILNSTEGYYLVDDTLSNEYNIQNVIDQTYSISGSLKIHLGNKTGWYNFTSSLQMY